VGGRGYRCRALRAALPGFAGEDFPRARCAQFLPSFRTKPRWFPNGHPYLEGVFSWEPLAVQLQEERCDGAAVLEGAYE